jgi:topoisomerase-4 subunit A
VAKFDFDFATLEIKGRSASGNILTRYPIRKIEKTAEGESTLGGIELWYDPIVGTLNTDERGQYLGSFEGDDQLLSVYRDGSYELKSYELTHKFDPEQTLLVEKFDSKTPLTAVYYDGNSKQYYVKRFLIETTTPGKRFSFITDARSSKLWIASTEAQPQAQVTFMREGSRKHEQQVFDLDVLVDIKGWKALGNRLTKHKVKSVQPVSAAPKAKKVAKPEHEVTPEKAVASNRNGAPKTVGDQVTWDF